jgi:hypothetical protein
MLDFLKWLFLRDRWAEDRARRTTEMMMQASEKWYAMGHHIADDCLENGLREGGIVRLSEIEEYIYSRHKYNADAIQVGFKERMKQFADSGEVLVLRVKGGDLAFVHERHADAVLKDA